MVSSNRNARWCLLDRGRHENKVAAVYWSANFRLARNCHNAAVRERTKPIEQPETDIQRPMSGLSNTTTRNGLTVNAVRGFGHLVDDAVLAARESWGRQSAQLVSRYEWWSLRRGALLNRSGNDVRRSQKRLAGFRKKL